MQSLPEWMHPRGDAQQLQTNARHTRKQDITRRALGSFAHLISEIIAKDAIANQQGLLQTISAQAKVIGIIGILIISTLVHSFTALILCLSTTITLAILSRIPIQRLTKAWLAVPLFSLAIMLPATLNIISEGNHIITLWHFSNTHFGPISLPKTLALTDTGLIISSRFILRTTLCVSLVLLLTTTTQSARLFHGLRALFVPKIFVMLLSMMERYLTVITRAAEEIHLAKISRSITTSPLRKEQAWAAAGIGAMFRRSQALGNEVYLAMISRGYTGEIYLITNERWQARDFAFILASAILGTFLLFIK